VETHLARGYYFYHCHRNYEEALAEFLLGMQIQPEHADLQNGIAAVQRRLGKLPEALESFQKAFRLDPRSHMKAFDIALTFGMLRQLDSTLEYLDYAIALKPTEPLCYIYKAWLYILAAGDTEGARRVLEDAQPVADLRQSEYYWWLTRIIYPDYGAHLGRRPDEGDRSAYYIHQGRLFHLQNAAQLQTAYYDSARVLLEALVMKQSDAARYFSWLGQAYAGLGQATQAKAAGDRAMELLPVARDAFDAPFLMVNYAESLVMLGDYAKATDQLESLLAMHGFVSVPYLKIDPLWRPLHGTPRFEALIADSSAT
jgi:tetratricopeptide (TPR) repeat protein